MSFETLLDIFMPPKGTVGHSAALVAMTGSQDFLEEAMIRFTELGKTQRSQLGISCAYLMLDGHASSSRQEVFPPGRIPGLHEFQPRLVNPGSLLHAKVALLAFAPNRTGDPVHIRLAVLTANYTYTSARRQLELVWVVDAPLDGTARPEDRADVAAAGAFLEKLLTLRFYRDEQGLASKDRKLTARLDVLLAAASSLKTNRKPRFIHSLERPLYDQIKERFGANANARNLLLCGSGFYEQPAGNAGRPAVLGKLEAMGVFTQNPRRIALVEPDQAGAIADWACAGEMEGWEVVRPLDAMGQDRRLHAKFVYAGYLREGHVSNGCLYLGSGNLSRRGILTHGGMAEGNVETGVVFAVDERLDGEATKRRLFWSDESETVADWVVGQVGDAPDAHPILEAPPILSALVATAPARRLRLLWREDAAEIHASISWTGRDWFDVQRDSEVSLVNEENPTSLQVRDANGRKWVVPVVDSDGRVGWQPPRFETYTDALAALLDFPIRPVESTDDYDGEEGDRVCTNGSGTGEAVVQEKSYALHAAAELVEQVAALQAVLPESMLDDWLDHLDRMFRASFPNAIIATWREHGINVFEHLKARALRPPHLLDEHAQATKRYFTILDCAARSWMLAR